MVDVKEQMTAIMPKKIIPIFILAGFTVTILFATVWIIALMIEGDWIFGKNALSDLGVGMSEASRILFNYGCVLTGMAGFIFGYGILKHEKGWLVITGAVTMIGTIALMGVGAVPESYTWPHMVCAGSFAILSLVAMITSAIGDYKKGRKKYCAIAVVLSIICLALVPFQFGIFEAVAIICILIWVFVQACKYYTIIGLVDYVDPLAGFFEEDNKRTSQSKDNKG